MVRACLPVRPSTGTSSASVSWVVRARIGVVVGRAVLFQVPPDGTSMAEP
jgi:hypothetical protein